MSTTRENAVDMCSRIDGLRDFPSKQLYGSVYFTSGKAYSEYLHIKHHDGNLASYKYPILSDKAFSKISLENGDLDFFPSF